MRSCAGVVRFINSESLRYVRIDSTGERCAGVALRLREPRDPRRSLRLARLRFFSSRRLLFGTRVPHPVVRQPSALPSSRVLRNGVSDRPHFRPHFSVSRGHAVRRLGALSARYHTESINPRGANCRWQGGTLPLSYSRELSEKCLERAEFLVCRSIAVKGVFVGAPNERCYPAGGRRGRWVGSTWDRPGIGTW